MSISNKIIEIKSAIRKVLKKRIQAKKKYGEDNVYDFSFENPDFQSRKIEKEILLEQNSCETTSHKYMSKSEYYRVRQVVANYLNRQYNVGITPNLIIMTSEELRTLCKILRVLLKPGEDILVPAPYNPKYNQYDFVANANLKTVASLDDFHLDLDAIAMAINKNTRAMLINSPNNPGGCVYGHKELMLLGKILDNASIRFGKRIYLISDESYSKIVYNVEVSSVFNAYPHSILLTSCSNNLALAGKKIGYLAIHPDAEDIFMISGAADVANDMTCFDWQAFSQQLVERLLEETIDISNYRKCRDMLCERLQTAGYELHVPEGSFYLFPKSPIKDDLQFVDILKNNNILAIPGSKFACPGHFRLSYAVAEETILDSFWGFKNAMEIVKAEFINPVFPLL